MIRRLGNLIMGFLRLFTAALEERNPEALLGLEQENLRKQLGNYNRGLLTHAGLCERVSTQVKRLEDEERSLRVQTAALVRGGKRQKAGMFALRLQTVERDLLGSRAQLARAEEVYRELSRARDQSFKRAQSQIQALRFELDDLKIRRATADLNEAASGLITQIGGPGGTLKRLQELVENERDRAAGKARIAGGAMDSTRFELDEAEQEALAEQALADFEISFKGLESEERMLFGRAEERCYSKTNSLVPDRREKIEIAMNSEGEKSKKENGLPIGRAIWKELEHSL
jgi:phage shock protein A